MQLTSNVPIYSIGIRGRLGSPTLFTSLDALHGVPGGNKAIAHLANGGGWATTIALINTDASPANFTLSFYNDQGQPLSLPLIKDGTRSSLPDTIQPGQIRIVQTDGTGGLSVGWAQLTTQNAIGGTCIFTEGGVSEAAVSISSAAGKTLYIPYDDTAPFLTGMALANLGGQPAQLTLTLTSDSGMTFQPSQPVPPIGPNGHSSVNVFDGSFATADSTRGLIRVDSNVDLFGVGIRSRTPANSSVTYFTALPVLPVNP